MKKLLNGMNEFLKDENGLTTAEWVILASAVAAGAIAVVGLILPKIRDMAKGMQDQLGTYNSDAGAK